MNNLLVLLALFAATACTINIGYKDEPEDPPPVVEEPIEEPKEEEPAKPVDVSVLIEDMTKPNDAKIKGYSGSAGWSKGGALMMGNCARGTCAPTYWTATVGPWNTDQAWTRLLPWFVVFQADGNTASDFRVQLKNMKVYLKDHQNQWSLLAGDTDGLAGDIYAMNLIDYVSRADTVKVDGLPAIKPSINGHIHGWWSKGRVQIDAAKIKAVHVTLEARLIGNEAAQAKYMIHVGGDYYPLNENVKPSTGMDWLPGIAVSRTKMLKPEWQKFTMTTIETAPREKLKNGANTGISEAELRQYPPPLN